jgi:hypothetical protein
VSREIKDGTTILFQILFAKRKNLAVFVGLKTEKMHRKKFALRLGAKLDLG